MQKNEKYEIQHSLINRQKRYFYNIKNEEMIQKNAKKRICNPLVFV